MYLLSERFSENINETTDSLVSVLCCPDPETGLRWTEQVLAAVQDVLSGVQVFPRCANLPLLSADISL